MVKLAQENEEEVLFKRGDRHIETKILWKKISAAEVKAHLLSVVPVGGSWTLPYLQEKFSLPFDLLESIVRGLRPEFAVKFQVDTRRVIRVR